MRGVSALQKLGLPQFAMKLSRVARPREKEGSLVSASAPQGRAARGRHGRAQEGPTKPPLSSPRAGGLGREKSGDIQPEQILGVASSQGLYHQFQGLEGRQIARAGLISDPRCRTEIIWSRPRISTRALPPIAQTGHTTRLAAPKSWSDLAAGAAKPAGKASLGKPGLTESYNPAR